MTSGRLRIGTAGWAIPRAVADAFPPDGSALARYGARLDAAEINTTFYRPHRASTYERWAATVPDGFGFTAKLPRSLTHVDRLVGGDEDLAVFLAGVAVLGPKLGAILIQLPPSLAFEPGVAAAFLCRLRSRCSIALACEPRHPSWFEPDADRLLCDHEVARVAADPLRHPAAGTPGGWPGLRYHRLHGSPHMYRSAYGEGYLADLARTLDASPVETWCIFDNTTLGAACADALRLRALVAGEGAVGARGASL